ncbi:thiolase family protein [soil metagenome]
MGAAELTPGKNLPYSFTELHALAAARALADAGLAPDGVDGLVCAGPMTDEGSIFLSEDLMDYLGLTNLKFQMMCQLGGGTHLAMTRVAMRIIAAGEAETVLVVSSGKFPTIRDGGRELMTAVCEHAFELPYGPSVPSLYGLIAQAWMIETGQDKTDIAEVSASQDRWAAINPAAITHGSDRISVDDVMASRPIAGPFNFYHCSIPCEGGGALVVGSADRARKGPHRPVHLLGFGEGHTHGFLTSMARPGRTGAALSAPMAFERSGRNPADIDICQLYDAFASNPAMILEESGFVKPGTVGSFYREGRADPGGDLPVNTDGGLIRFGHTGTSSGISQILEAYWQLSGRADGRQVPGADTGFVHSYGSMLCSHVSLVLEGE